MAIATVIEVRPNLLRGALTLLGAAASGACEAMAQERGRRSRDQLFAQAAALVDEQFRVGGDVLSGPISLLQRRFDLGYGAALGLSERLEEAQIWTVYRDEGGMRCARRCAHA